MRETTEVFHLNVAEYIRRKMRRASAFYPDPNNSPELIILLVLNQLFEFKMGPIRQEAMFLDMQ